MDGDLTCWYFHECCHYDLCFIIAKDMELFKTNCLRDTDFGDSFLEIGCATKEYSFDNKKKFDFPLFFGG